MKEPFIDVLVLYAEKDRKDVEIFKTHLETEIILLNSQKVVPLLYDLDFQGLSGSKLQHLDLAVERSRYVFVYLTKSFVEEKWCEISSESCLMKAIYDEEKRRCVVPVYTKRRHKCKFKIPMGLNSLKGINYYNYNKFYRDGVARLIGDKVNVKFRMQKEFKVKQKEWIEKFNRDQEKHRQLRLRTQRQEEGKTCPFKEWLRMAFMHPFSSTKSLKDMHENSPHASDYFHWCRLLILNQGSGHPMHPERNAYKHQYPNNPTPFSPHINTSAAYSHNKQAVQRSPSQSAVSNDAANSHPVPLEILDKIKDLPRDEQMRYSRFYQETQGMQLQQQADIQVPTSQMEYLGQGTRVDPGQMIQIQQFASPGLVQGPALNTDIITDPLKKAPSLYLSLIGQGQVEGHCSHVNKTVGPQEMGQTSQVPNITFDQSMNSYHPESVSCTFSVGESNVTSENGVSFSTDQGSESHGQNVDWPRGTDEVGNLLDLELFYSVSQLISLEEDSGTHSIPSFLTGSPDKTNIKKTMRETECMECDRRKKKVTGTKTEKPVYNTTNIYQAKAVQVGDSNICIVKGFGKCESESEDSDKEHIDQPGKDLPSRTAKKPVNPNIALYILRNFIQGQRVKGEEYTGYPSESRKSDIVSYSLPYGSVGSTVCIIGAVIAGKSSFVSSVKYTYEDIPYNMFGTFVYCDTKCTSNRKIFDFVTVEYAEECEKETCSAVQTFILNDHVKRLKINHCYKVSCIKGKSNRNASKDEQCTCDDQHCGSVRIMTSQCSAISHLVTITTAFVLQRFQAQIDSRFQRGGNQDTLLEQRQGMTTKVGPRHVHRVALLVALLELIEICRQKESSHRLVCSSDPQWFILGRSVDLNVAFDEIAIGENVSKQQHKKPEIDIVVGQQQSVDIMEPGAFKRHSLTKPLGQHDVKCKSSFREFQEKTLNKDKNEFRTVSNEKLVEEVLEVLQKLFVKPNRFIDVDVGEYFVKETNTKTDLYEPLCFKDLDLSDSTALKTAGNTEVTDSGINHDDWLFISLKGNHSLGLSVPLHHDVATLEKAEKPVPSLSLNGSAELQIDAFENVEVRDVSDGETVEEEVNESLPKPCSFQSSAETLLLKQEQKQVKVIQVIPPRQKDSSVENEQEKTDKSPNDVPEEVFRYKECLISDLFGHMQMTNLCKQMNRLACTINNMLEKLDGLHVHKPTKTLLKNHGSKIAPKGSSFRILKHRIHMESVKKRKLTLTEMANPPYKMTTKVCEKSEIVDKLVSISSNISDARTCQQTLIKVFFNDSFMRKELMKCMRMRREVRNFELIRLLVFRLRAPTLMIQDRNLKVFMEKAVVNTILQAMTSGSTRHGAFKRHSLTKPLGQHDVKCKSSLREFQEKTQKKDEFDKNEFIIVSSERLVEEVLEVLQKKCVKPNRFIVVDVGECFVKETNTKTELYEPQCFKDFDLSDSTALKTAGNTEVTDSGINHDDCLLIPLKGNHSLGACVPLHQDVATLEKAEKPVPSFSLNGSAELQIDGLENEEVRDVSDGEIAEEEVSEPLPEPCSFPSSAETVLLKQEHKQVKVIQVIPPRQSENSETIGQFCREYLPKQVRRNIKSKGSPFKSRKSTYRGGAYTEDDLKSFIRDHTWLPVDKLPPPSIDLTTITVANVTNVGLDPIFRGMALGENLGPATTMKYELLRLCTFRNYPKDNKPYLIRLAGAGFYYAADGDQVVCYCCGVRRNSWSANEKPEVVHRRLSPRCGFFLRNHEVNFPVPKVSQGETQRFALLEEFKAPEDEGQDFVPDNGQNYRQYQFRTSEKPAGTTSSRMTPSELGINTQTPKHPHYAVRAVRESSYGDAWPESSHQDPKIMAEAGFYFAGIGDCVRCFQCGVGLRHWAAEDNPWIEHARWAQTCQYLRQYKGEEFINLVQMAVQITQDEEANSSGGQTGNSMSSILVTDAAQSVIEMGYDTGIIRRAIEHLLRNNSRAEVTAARLMEKVIELEDADNAASEREMQANARQNAATSGESGLTVSNAVASAGVSSQAGTMGQAGTPGTTVTTVVEDPKKIKAENDKLKEQTLCKICMDKTVCIVFLPCGHLVTCAECAPALRKCPICRSLVKGTVKTYMS